MIQREENVGRGNPVNPGIEAIRGPAGWKIRITINIEDESGVRPAVPGECEIILASGTPEGFDSLTATLGYPGDWHTTADNWIEFWMCPSTFGVVECGVGGWGIKVKHIATGKTMCCQLQILDSTYTVGTPYECAW